jgi:DNA-binding LacI/PurR family transcriptional regulator
VAEEWSEGDVRFRTYCITGQRMDAAAYRRLCDDLADGGLAGIVFVNTPFYLEGSPIFASAVPRVCIGGGDLRDTAVYGYSQVNLSEGDVPGRIVRRFQAAGRKRMACLAALTVSGPLHAQYQPILRSLGMETRPEWWLGLPVDPVGAASARTVAHLLLSGPERLRPDCLLIADDNLVPHATAGVQDAGLRVPEGVDIAAHANYPGPTLAAVPCLRFGPDMAAQVRAAVAEIAALAAGGKPRIIGVPLEFRDA